ncbi:glycosyltransferase family 2 protein [Alkalibacterium sp. MB6]|uniref:glycosyltransferase family 2 protein n=1 Tax=Alkalibacterium sp. MB6 TaxID=2081965 RepID=UPI001379CB58|nr:glycosyltransferase family 2 protein [Alkalibacterium sp. MB6]
MNQPLVSIIVPAYNVERYIEECIDSLLNQTYKNIEIIVLDDASTDATLYLLKQYEGRIQIIENELNQGQGARRNQGMKLAKGEYIYFIDSDDWIEMNTIEELVEQAVKTDADLVRFNGKSFSEGEVTLEREGQYNFSHQLEHQKVYRGDDLLEKNRRSFSASPCLYLIKKSVIDQHNLYFLEGVLHEDEYFTTRLFYAIESMTYINKAYYNRRYRVASTMTEQSNLHKLKSFESYLKIFKALEKDYQRPELKPAQKQFIKRQLLSVYNGLQQADIHPENKRKLKELKSVTFKDKVFLVLAKIKQRM